MPPVPGSCQFLHDLNPDGTVDSICLECFQVAADHADTSDLEFSEFFHACRWRADVYKRTWPEEAEELKSGRG